MNRLKRYTVTGVFFVLFCGTISHLLYEWTGNNFIVGLFVPVNESIWEHMKLLFFPMLLYSLFLFFHWKKDSCIASSFAAGILSGTLLIPVIFYTYTGILGRHVFILDILTFILSVIAAFYTAYQCFLSHKIKKYPVLMYLLVAVLMICFLIFTYHPPKIGLFAVP